MNREDIKRWATQAQLPQSYDTGEPMWLHNLERFAALVAASEREACAELIESRKTGADDLMDAVRDMEARAIRARGNT